MTSRHETAFMIITDLDGSLLDHQHYDWVAAEPCLCQLKNKAIPIVFCSSKTQSEIEALQRQMGLFGQPYIAENGAILSINNKIQIISEAATGLSYLQITEILSQMRTTYGFKFVGFHDVETTQVVQLTGLSLEQAQFSQDRIASEPILWQDSLENFALFQQVLTSTQLDLIQGGRFWHVMNAGSHKGAAFNTLIQHELEQQRVWKTIGLGDSPNDLSFLELTDYTVIIRSALDHTMLLNRKDMHNIYHSQYQGPQGWCEGIRHFLL